MAFPKDLTTNGALDDRSTGRTAPVLAGDRVRLAQVELPWRLAAQPNGLVIEDLRLRSDVGQLAVRGTIDPSAVAGGDLELRQRLRSGPAGEDAAACTANSQRHDNHIRHHSIGGPLAAGRRRSTVTGSLQTAQLAATSAGRPIRWDQPVSANFALRRQHRRLRLDTLKCDSDFLKIDASGTPQQLAATAEFDLNKLAEHLGQFVDLNGIDLAGTGSAKLDMQQTAPQQYAATATGQLAQLRIAAGAHQLSTSQSEFAANIREAGGLIEATDAKVIFNNLRATSPGWNINEPRAELAGDVHWNSVTSEISAGAAQLVTSAVSLATKDVRYRPPQPNAGQAGIAQLTGMAAFRADLARLAAWRASPQQPSAYQPSGEVIGQARFLQQGDRITGELNATGQNLATPAQAPGNRIRKRSGRNRNSQCAALAVYAAPSDELTFEQFQIQSNTLQAAATGKIDKLSTAADMQVNGTLNYDLAQITPLLKPYLGDGIRLVGREQAQFALAGQLKDSSGIAAQQVGFSANLELRIRNPNSIGPAAFAVSLNCHGPAQTCTACRSARAGSRPRSATARSASSRSRWPSAKASSRPPRTSGSIRRPPS